MKTIFANGGSTLPVEMLVAFANEITIGEDGWAQIAPFGDFPGMVVITDDQGGIRKERAIQRMDRQAVATMVAEFEQSRRGVSKFLNSRPIYLGHPDMPGGAAKYPDKKPKGVFANVALRDGGFYGEPILTDEGEELVAAKKVRAFSGRWEADEYLGEEMIGGKKMKVFRPTRFLSAGMTDRPNLPVELFNEAESELETSNNNQHTEMKKETVIALFASLGILTPRGATFANDASDEDVTEGLKQLGAKAKQADTLTAEKATFANEKAQLEQRVASKDGEIGTLKTEKATVTTERDTARTQFANERAARVGELIDGAVRDGRITAAERPTWDGRLKNETTFANEAEALRKLEAKTKVSSITLQRGDRKVEISNAAERRDMISTLVNEEMAASKCSHDAALAKVRKGYGQLFEGMKEPKIEMPRGRR